MSSVQEVVVVRQTTRRAPRKRAEVDPHAEEMEVARQLLREQGRSGAQARPSSTQGPDAPNLDAALKAFRQDKAHGKRGQEIPLWYPDGVETVVVRRFGDDFVEIPVPRGISVLNLQTDLLKHLNEYPFSDEWWATLRNFIDAKLEARRQARATGGVAVPTPQGDGFVVLHGFRKDVEVTA